MYRLGTRVTAASPVGDKVAEAQIFFHDLARQLRITGANLVAKSEVPVSQRREIAAFWLHDMGAIERMIDSFVLFPDVRVTYTVAESLPLTCYAVNSLDMVSVVDAHDVPAGQELTIPGRLDVLSTISDIARVSLRRVGIDQTKLFGTIPFRSEASAGRVTTADLAVDISKQSDRDTNGFTVEAA